MRETEARSDVATQNRKLALALLPPCLLPTERLCTRRKTSSDKDGSEEDKPVFLDMPAATRGILFSKSRWC